MKPTISKPFKSNDRTFEKVFGLFNKKDYFNVKGLAKTQIGNFERALQKNDKNAKKILDKFKGDMGKAKDYITQVITDRKKEQAFNDYKALKHSVDSIQKGKPNVGAVDYVKRIIHNNNQKYSIALYSAISGKKFNNYKDIHKDIDSLIGESVNELSDKDRKKIEFLRKTAPGYIGPKFAKKASDADILVMADLQDQKARIYNRYVKVVDDAITKLHKKYRINQESVNEDRNSNMFYVLYQKKGVFGKPAAAGYKNRKDAEKFAKSLGNNHNTMILDKQSMKNVKGVDVKEGYNPMVESKTKESKVIQKIYKYSRTEKKFYDELAKHEVRIGQRDYAKFIIMALKGFGINPRQYKRIPDAEEKLYQTVSKK